MRQVSAALALVLFSATGALAQESGAAATELRTVTTGQCDGRSASLEVTRGNTAGTGSVATVLDGRRIQMEPIISDRLLALSGAMEVTITCTATDVTFAVETHATEAGGAEPQLVSRQLSFGLRWPTPAA